MSVAVTVNAKVAPQLHSSTALSTVKLLRATDKLDAQQANKRTPEPKPHAHSFVCLQKQSQHSCTREGQQ